MPSISINRLPNPSVPLIVPPYYINDIWYRAFVDILSLLGGPAGGDLGGTYPDPIVVQINGHPLSSTIPVSGNLLIGNGTAWNTQSISGDVTLSPTGVITVNPSGVVGTTYTVNGVPFLGINSKGFVTSATNISITSTGTAGGDLTGTYPNPNVISLNSAPLGSTAPTSGNVFIGTGSVWQSTAVSGDATLSNIGGMVVTKTNGVSFATSATTDTTNASNIGSGTLTAARMGSGSPSSTTTLLGNNTWVSTMPTAILGSGSATASTFLAGNNTWATINNSGTANQVAYYNSSGIVLSGGTLQNISGVASSAASAAGMAGEVISSSVLVASAITLTSNIVANITSISLTAGDWDFWGHVHLSNSAGNVIVSGQGWISTVSASIPDASVISQVNAGGTQILGFNVSGPPLRLNSTTIVYLSTVAAFTSGTTTASGYIYARRRT